VTYRQILGEKVFPEIRSTMNGQSWTWQQDGAPPHTAKNTQDWLENNCNDWIKKDEWPAKSPDLNPMDFGIWGILLSKLAEMRQDIKTLTDLKSCLRSAWEDIQLSTVKKICLNWGKRLQAVQLMDGGHFEHKL